MGDFGFTKHGERTTECGICGFFAFCWAFLWLITLTLNLGLFYGSLRSFFAWLGFLCVELAFCGTAFVRLTARLWLAFLGFLPAFSLNKKATAWLLLAPFWHCLVILSAAKYPQNQSVDSSPAAQNDKAQTNALRATCHTDLFFVILSAAKYPQIQSANLRL